MQEAVRVSVKLHPGVFNLVEVGVRGEEDGQVIGSVGNENAHVHPPQTGELQRSDHGLIRDEVGTRDPQTAARRVDGVNEHQGRCFELVRRTGGHYQHPRVAIGCRVRRPVQFQHLSGGPVPVLDERELGGECRGPLDAHVRVPPVPELRVPAHVLIPHVVASDPDLAPVHHHDLPVVAEVDLEPVARPLSGVEVEHLGPGVAKLLLVLLRQILAAHLVVQEVDAHSFPGLCQQVLLHLGTQLVVLHDEELEQDVVARPVYSLEDAGKRRLAVDQKLGLVSA